MEPSFSSLKAPLVAVVIIIGDVGTTERHVKQDEVIATTTRSTGTTRSKGTIRTTKTTGIATTV